MYTCSEDGEGSRWHSAAELLHPYDSAKAPEPLTVVGQQVIHGFDPDALRSALAPLGYRIR